MEGTQEREPFTVKDDRAAEWCLKKIAEANEEQERMLAWYYTQIETLKKQTQDEVSYFKGLLRAYFETVPAKETKTQRKYNLPSGSLVFHKAKQDFGCDDPETLVGWCLVNDPALVKTEVRPRWADIKKRLTLTDAGIVDTETGLKVEGVVMLDKPEEFDVTLKGVQ